MYLRSSNVRHFRNNAATLIAAIVALTKWRRRSRARRALARMGSGSVGSVRRHPVRTVLGAIALGMGVRALVAARHG
jgi:hypothetical protein